MTETNEFWKMTQAAQGLAPNEFWQVTLQHPDGYPIAMNGYKPKPNTKTMNGMKILSVDRCRIVERVQGQTPNNKLPYTY